MIGHVGCWTVLDRPGHQCGFITVMLSFLMSSLVRLKCRENIVLKRLSAAILFPQYYRFPLKGSAGARGEYCGPHLHSR